MRYFLFYGWDFHPLGGWDDYCGVYDSIEAAKDKLRMDIKSHSAKPDWYQIVDTYTRRVAEHGGIKYDEEGAKFKVRDAPPSHRPGIE